MRKYIPIYIVAAGLALSGCAAGKQAYSDYVKPYLNKAVDAVKNVEVKPTPECFPTAKVQCDE